MRIAINLFPIYKLKEGVDVYALNLVKNLSLGDSQNKYFLFINKDIKNLINDLNSNFKIVVCPFCTSEILKRLFWELFIFPFQLYFLKIDICHFVTHSIFFLSPFIKCDTIITIHDLIFLRVENKFNSLKTFYYRFVMPFNLRRGSRIISVSQKTKHDLIETYKIDADKIDVIYHGIYMLNRSLGQSQSANNILEKYGIRKPFILYVGALEKSKNIARLLYAFCEINQTIKNQYRLVLVGKKRWNAEDYNYIVEKLGISNLTIFTDYVSDDELNYIYSQAEIFVFPSLYEGFGFPPLEAMAFGIPVVVSNRSSLPEIVGDAGLFFNPYSINDIKTKIEKLINNPSLKIKLSQLGKRRVKKFTWQTTANKTLNIYRGLNE